MNDLYDIVMIIRSSFQYKWHPTKTQVVLGAWNGTDAVGISPVTATVQPFNGSVVGLTALPVLTIADSEVRLGLADLRGDGKKDIICSNGLVLLGNGDGTLTPVAASGFPPAQNVTQGIPLGMASGDLNNDGNVDLVIGTGSGISTSVR